MLGSFEILENGQGPRDRPRGCMDQRVISRMYRYCSRDMFGACLHCHDCHTLSEEPLGVEFLDDEFGQVVSRRRAALRKALSDSRPIVPDSIVLAQP